MAAVVAAGVMARPAGRSSVASILRTVASPQLLIPFLVTAGWTAVVVWAGWRISIWDAALTTTTVIWFLTAGVVLFGRAASKTALTDPHFLRGTVSALLSMAAFLGAYVSLVTFPLWAEVILQSVLVIASLLYAFTSRESRYAGCVKGLLGLFIAAAIAQLSYVTLNLVVNWSTTDWRSLLAGVLLPLWLTVGMLFLVYPLAFYSAYQGAVTRVAVARLPGELSRTERIRIWLALMAELRLHPADIKSVDGVWAGRLAGSQAFAEALAVVRELRVTRRGPGETG